MIQNVLLIVNPGRGRRDSQCSSAFPSLDPPLPPALGTRCLRRYG